MLHHVFFVNHGRFRGDRRAGDCRRRNGETFYGTGEEDQAIELPAGYGYRLRKRDRWRVGWMFMNHRHMRERVYLAVHGHGHRRAAHPGHAVLDQRELRGRQDLQRPRRRRTCTSSRAPGPARAAGRIVAAAAHAHGGALEVDVADERCGGRRLLVLDGALRPPRGPDLQPVAGPARALPAQHERGDLGSRLGGEPRRPPERHLALRE